MNAYNALLEQQRTPLIIDAGGHIGAAAVWFATQFPKARVVSVEPDPDNAALCRENTGRLGNVEVWQAAIGGSNGSGSVQIFTIPWIESMHDDWSLFLVKVDIEGFEADLFAASDLSWLDRTSCLIIEPHDWLVPGTSQSLQQAMASRDCDLVISGENLVYVRRGAGKFGQAASSASAMRATAATAGAQ